WACDTALLFVNSATGVAVNTRRMWNAAGAMGKARAIVVSKMDLENADPERVLGQIASMLGDRCRPINLPVGRGAAFKSVVRCFGPGEPVSTPTLGGDAGAARNAFIETVVEVDDALLEKYLGGETISDEEMGHALRQAVAQGK